jgi:cytochrome P450
LFCDGKHRKLVGMSLPPSMPLPTAVQSLIWIRRPTEFMHFLARRYGHAFRLKLPAFEISMFSDPESIRTMFSAKSDEMHAGETNRILRALVGDRSVLLLDDAEHLRHRKLLLPSFHGERMRLYGETMAEITRQGIAHMARFRSDEVFSLHPHTQQITLQVILRTVFGADEGAELETLSARIKRMLGASEHRISFVLMIYLASRPQLEGRLPWRYLLAPRNEVDALLYHIIAERRVAQRASGHERTDVLAMLMQARDEAGKPLSDRELRDELMTALAAGHETTATALAWAFECILSHPEVHTRLREEIAAIGGVDASPEKLTALPYLDATIKEVMRLRPIVPIVGRKLMKPMSLGGYDLPAGTLVGACIYLAQRNPEVYPDPARFQPERFLGVPTDPVSWLPFGGGIRRCIGAQFATYELKIVLGTLLAHCEFELAQASPIRPMRRAVTLFPEHGTRVRLLRCTRPENRPAQGVSGRSRPEQHAGGANGHRGARVS